MRLMVHLQLTHSDGWLPVADVRQLTGLDPASMGRLIEIHGNECRPIGYPVAEVARQKRVSAIASERNKSQCSNAPMLQCSNALGNVFEVSEPENGAKSTQVAETQGEGARATGVKGQKNPVAKKSCSTQEEDIYIIGPKDVGPKELQSSFLGERGSMEVGIVKGRNHGERGATVPDWCADLLFATKDFGQVALSLDDYQALRTAHSENLLRTQLPLAALWLRTNADKRKAAKGLMRFLANWLKREASGKAGTGIYGAPSAEKKPRGEWSGVWRVGK
jgi:hypothetical protein